MAAPTDRVRPAVTYIPAGTEDDDLTDEEMAFNAFQEEFTESDSYAKITVYRQPTGGISTRPGQRKLTFLFECGLDDYTYSQLLSKLRDEYGSGVFRLQARDANGKLLFNRSAEIEAPKRPVHENGRQESPTELLNSFQEMMAAQQERTEALIARLRVPDKPAENPMQMMSVVMSMVTQLMSALAPAISSKPQTDLLGELEKFAKLKEFATAFVDTDSGDSKESNFYSLATKTVESFGPAIVAALPHLANRATPGLVPPNTGPANMSPKPNTGPANMPPKPSALKSQVNILVSNAKAGVDPIQMASNVLDLTPDEKLDDLYQFIADPHCIERMAAENPDVRTYTDFFSKLRNELLNQLRDESETDTLAATESAGVGGTADNAG